MKATLRETRSQDVNLNAIIDGIDTGQVVLPNFQRDFDWSEADVRSLLGTVLNGWPMGSLLLIEGNDHKEFYSPRPVVSAPAVSEDVVYTILDGQQRLTSLYQALTDRSKDVFALKLDRGIDYSDVDALDEAIVTIPREVWSKAEQQISVLGEQLLPFAALRDASAFYEWRDHHRFNEEFDEWLTKTYRNHLSGIHTYRVPAVIVDSAIEPSAVARVFERVNRTGMKLGTFDLMVAKSYSSSFNLRAAWEKAQADHPILERMLKDDGLPILTAIALREFGDVRQSSVMDLSRDNVEEFWGEAASHYAAAADFAEVRLGVLNADWLPYRQILTVLAALDYAHPLKTIAGDVENWFWNTGFGRRYDAASNTRAVSDYRDLLARRDPIRAPLVLIREQALEATRGQQGAWHRAYLCALAADATGRNAMPSSKVVARSVFGRGSGELVPALHLRTLTFALWDSESGRPIDGLGAPVELPAGIGGLNHQLVKLQTQLSNSLMFRVHIVSAQDESVRDTLVSDLVSGE